MLGKVLLIGAKKLGKLTSASFASSMAALASVAARNHLKPVIGTGPSRSAVIATREPSRPAAATKIEARISVAPTSLPQGSSVMHCPLACVA